MRIKGNDIIISTGGSNGGKGSVYTRVFSVDDWVKNEDGTYHIYVNRGLLNQLGRQITYDIYKRRTGGKYYNTHNIPGEGYIAEFDNVNNFKLTVDKDGRFDGKIIFQSAMPRIDISDSLALIYERHFNEDDFMKIDTGYLLEIHLDEYYNLIGEASLGFLYRYDSINNLYYTIGNLPGSGYKFNMSESGEVSLEVNDNGRFTGKIVLLGAKRLHSEVIATKTSLGSVMIGDNLVIDSTGRLSAVSSVTPYKYIIDLPVSAWILGETGEYTQIVELSEFTEDMSPSMSPVVDMSNINEAKSTILEYGSISYLQIGNGYAKFYCFYDRPKQNLQIELTGVKNNVSL